jgi:prepilin-type N-terminal cleavage/methylation domain-containing protein
MRKYSESEKGFTLIELMVAMAIFVLLTTGFVLKFSRTGADTKLHITVTQVVGAIKEARYDAVTVVQYGNSSGIFPSYGVYFDKSKPKELTIYADCVIDDDGNGILNNNDNFTYSPSGTGCTGGPSADGFVKTIQLQNGVSISAIRTVVGSTTTSENKAYIEYIRPLPSVWITGATSGILPYGHIEIDLSDPQGGSIKTISVYTSGLVTPTLSNSTANG